MYEECNGAEKYYFYDSNGIISGIRYYDANGNMTMIYVVTNSQGDVIALYDRNGNAVVEYQYDAWGNIISTTNTTEGSSLDWNEINPFRYRGYYYDSEIGLYYLQSRYYDAETGRFLNADDTSVINATPDALTDKNLFAYCDNNPVVRIDDKGDFWLTAIGISAGVGAVAGLVGQVITDVFTSAMTKSLTVSNWQTYLGAVAGGALGGVALGLTRNINVANAATGFFTTGISLSLEKITTDDYDKSWGEIGANAVADSAISYGLGKLPGINKITKGRNSHSAVYKSGLTKLWNGNASGMSSKVIKKGITSSVLGGVGLDIYYADKTVYYSKAKMLFKRLG